MQTNDIAALSITSPASYAGALVLNVMEGWTNADGSTGSAIVSDNVEVFAKGAPIFAWSGRRQRSPEPARTICSSSRSRSATTSVYSFNVNEDQIDLIGYAEFASFNDVKSDLTAEANGNAVITLADGQSITFYGVASTSLSASNFVFNQEPVTDNAGAITIGDGAVLPLSGIIDNTGTIALDRLERRTKLQLIQNGITLEGGGQVILSDSSENFIAGTIPSVTLTNVDNTISGAGQLGAGQMTLVNEWHD